MPRIVTQKSTVARTPSENARSWYLVDAEGQTLGRLATRIARVLTGRDRADFTPHVDTGAHVVVVNAAKIHVSGSKMTSKVYRHHTGYMGGLKETTLAALHAKNPIKPLREAVNGMLPKHSHRTAMIRRLHLYAGAEHKHEAQKLSPLR